MSKLDKEWFRTNKQIADALHEMDNSYWPYEYQDMLDTLSEFLIEVFKQGKPVNFSGVGRFDYRVQKGCWQRSSDGVFVWRQDSYILKFVPLPQTKRVITDSYRERNAVSMEPAREMTENQKKHNEKKAKEGTVV